MDRNHTILVVDDSFVNRRLVTAMLHGEPYRLVEMECGRDGLDHILAHRDEIDLVLLDVGMPDISGTEVCHSVRMQENGGRRLPLIAYTAHAMAEERRAFLDAGFDDILTKPITREEFLSLLDKHLRDRDIPEQEHP